MKKAFTLAEVMIVLVVIGVLSSILMPIAFHSAPDENVVKFKKASTTLGTVIRELVSSDKYYQSGNLGLTVSGGTPSATYLCETMADVLAYKKKACSSSTAGTGAYAAGSVKSNVDAQCAKVAAAEIITPDGVSWFQAGSATTFGNATLSAKSGGFYSNYKVLCFDVDGIGVGEAPFGYGVRIDGRIIAGARAEEWTQKSVQRGD